MERLRFRKITVADKETVQSVTFRSRSQNCDLNFVNLCSWQFLYGTELAMADGWPVFRFLTRGRTAYMLPFLESNPKPVLQLMLDDARRQGRPFLMLGVCEDFIPVIDRAMPGVFRFTHDRDYTDYVYSRNALATLAGRHLQAKRNHVNKFVKEYPGYEFRRLTPDLIPMCRELETIWNISKHDPAAASAYENERRSMEFVFNHWEEIGPTGGCIFAEGSLVAFTYGAQINGDTFDVCVEKADTRYDGAFAAINRDFVRSLPGNFAYINREEDLGISGLRQAKLSYQPAVLLHKYSVTERRPCIGGQAEASHTEAGTDTAAARGE